jgi:hypothetical protein
MEHQSMETKCLQSTNKATKSYIKSPKQWSRVLNKAITPCAPYVSIKIQPKFSVNVVASKGHTTQE